MKQLFDETSFEVNALITNKYSTSFSRGITLFHKSVRYKIYTIYGFVRLADEIVDSFQGYPQKVLFSRFKEDYALALKQKISTNPVINAFQKISREYDLEGLVHTFLQSMDKGLGIVQYKKPEEIQSYIHGSAEVVGLMCLKVFIKNNTKLYEKLKPYAIKLGSAFQKVNFLRDMKDDMFRLGRVYFPGVDLHNLSDENKNALEKKQYTDT